MIPKIIHFAVPKKTTPDQDRVIARARELHPTWEIKVWQDPVDSANFKLRDYHEKINSGAQLADLIRLDAVYLHGGIYLDSDVFLQRDLSPLLDQDNFFCSEDGQNLTNAVFAATPRHALISELIEDLLDNEPDWHDPPNITTGPVFFSRILKWQNNVTLLPRETFYPYNWDEDPVTPPDTCYGIHEWAGSWVAEKHAKKKSPVELHESFAKTLLKRLASPFCDKIADRIATNLQQRNEPTPRAYPQYGDLVVKTTRGILMSVSGSDLSITPELALNGTYEEAELKFLERELRGGDFFIDVGSNVGVFSLVAARRVCAFGRVFAYDANPAVLEHLNRSLVMNWMHDRCITLHRAVGATPGTVTLQFSEKRLGDGNIGLKGESTFHKSISRIGELREVEVELVRLDDEFPFDQEIKILKIDVEGFEHQVLNGAERLLKNRCVKFVLMELLEEVAGRQHSRNLEMVNWVLEQGYVLGTIQRTGTFLKSKQNKADRKLSRNIVLLRA